MCIFTYILAHETEAPSLDRYNSAKDNLKVVIESEDLRPVLVRLGK